MTLINISDQAAFLDYVSEMRELAQGGNAYQDHVLQS